VSLAHLPRHTADKATLPVGVLGVVDLVAQACDQILIAGFLLISLLPANVLDEFQWQNGTSSRPVIATGYRRFMISSSFFRSSSGMLSRGRFAGCAFRSFSGARSWGDVAFSGGYLFSDFTSPVISYQKNQMTKAANQITKGVMTKRRTVLSQWCFFLFLLCATARSVQRSRFNVSESEVRIPEVGSVKP
jgi:hypothetical protein